MNTTKILFYTGLCWHTGLLFLIVGSEDSKENFYDLIVYLAGIKTKLNIKDSYELSLANKKTHRNPKNHRTNRTTTKNMIQMQ